MASELGRTLRAAALCLAACGVFALSGRVAHAAPGAFAASDDDFLRAVTQVLRAERCEDEETFVAALARLDAPSVPAMFETLHRGALAPLSESDEPRVLSEFERHAVLLALKRMPEAWRARCAALAASEGLRPERTSAAVVLGEIGESGDFPLLFALTRPTPAPAGSTASTTQPPETVPLADVEADVFQRAVELLLARDQRSYRRLEAPFRAADAQLQMLVIQKVAAQSCEPALEFLARVLGAKPELDLQLLTAISRVAGSLAPPFEPAIEVRARAFLSSNSPDVQREAALAAGKLEDAEALPFLIALLAHEHRGVRENAYWSLRKITGLGFKAEPQAWAPWLEEQTRWWTQTAPELFAELANADRAQALSIVQTAARRRFPRHELAAALASGLSHEDAEVRRLTCAALAQLRSRVVVPGLVDRLEDSDPEVRKEAWRAARSITGLDLPAESSAWSRVAR